MARGAQELGTGPAVDRALGRGRISGGHDPGRGHLLAAGGAAEKPDRPTWPPHMTISIGVAERSTQDDSLSQLIHRADMAMYQAKRQGRNQTMLAQVSPPFPELTCTSPDAASCGCQGASSVSDATFTGAP